MKSLLAAKPSATAVSLARSLGRGVPWHEGTIQHLFHATCNMQCATEAPAIQLAEHAQAILEDDARHGFERHDPVLKRLAAGSSHAAACLPHVMSQQSNQSIFLAQFVHAFKQHCTYTRRSTEARECFRALDAANLRAPLPVSFGRIGADSRAWAHLTSCLNFAEIL